VDEETTDLAFQLAQLRIEFDEAQKVIAAARDVVSAEQIDLSIPVIAALRAAIALYDHARPKPANT
jgi:hypothetical protein